MKKSNLTVYLALIIVVTGVILQFMEGGLFGENPIPEITQYNQIIFWVGIGTWFIGYVGKEQRQKKEVKKNQTRPNSEK